MLAGSLVYKIATDMSGLDRGLDDADRKVSSHGRKSGQQFGDAFNRGVSNTRIDTSSIERAFRDSGNRISSVMTGIFQGIGISIANSITNAITSAVSFGINKIKELSAFVYQVGSDFRNLQIAFRTIIGDQAKADKLIKDLRQFSAATPYTGTEVTQASQKLLTVVRPEDMVKTLQRLGDVAAGTKSRLGELATIYQQVLTKGKFQAEEMLQFAERGIPIQEEVAKVLGVQKSELEDLGRKGKITSDVMVAAFKNMAGEGGKFNGIMQQQSNTAAGMASTLQDKFEQVAVSIYDKVEPALKQILKSMDVALSKAGQQSNMLDIIGRASENVAKWFQTHQDLLNKAAIAASKFADESMSQLVKEAENLAKYLEENPEALKEAWNGAKEFLVVMQDLAKVTLELLGALAKIGKELYNILKPIDQFMRSIPTMEQAIGQAHAEGKVGILPGISTGFGLFGGGNNSAAVNGGKFRVADPHDSHVTSFEDSSPHHDYQRIRGGGRAGNLVKDMTLFQGNSSAVPVPSPVAGKVTHAGKMGGYGNAVIVQTLDGEQVLLGHMQWNSLKVKAGQQVARGQTLGIQGSTGNSTGVHLHIEARDATMKRYYESLISGNWGSTASAPIRSGGSIPVDGNRNMWGFLQAIKAGETMALSGDKAWNAKNHLGYKGAFQFSPAARADVFRWTGNNKEYDVWGRPDQQIRGATEWIKRLYPGAYNQILQGDFVGAARKLNRAFTSLPGGAEQSRVWSTRSINYYKPGNPGFQEGAGGDSSMQTLGQREQAATQQKQKIQAELAKAKAEKAAQEAKKRQEETEKQRQLIIDSEREAADSEIEVLRARFYASNDARDKFKLEIAEIDLKYNRDLQDIEQDSRNGYPKATLDTRRKNAIAVRASEKQRARNDYQKYLTEKADSDRKAQEDKQKQLAEEASKKRDAENAISTRIRNSYINKYSALASTPDEKMDVEISQASAKLSDLIYEIEGLGRSGEATAEQVAVLKGNAEEFYKAEVQNIKARYQKEREEREAEELARDKQNNQAKAERINTAIANARQREYDRRDNIFSTSRTLAESDLSLLQAKAGRIVNPDKQRLANIDVGTRQIGMELGDQLQSIEEMGRSGQYTAEQLERMKNNAHEIAEIKLDALNQQFQSLGEQIKGSVGSAFGGFLQSIVTGTQSIGDAFNSMIQNIISSLANMAIQRLLGSLFGAGIGAFAGGGMVEALATGGSPGRGVKFDNLSDAFRYERAVSGRKPMLAVLHEGEMVIPAKDVPQFQQVHTFANGNIGFKGSPVTPSNNIDFGDWHFQSNAEINPSRLQDMIKAAVYSVLQRETGAGGMINKR